MVMYDGSFKEIQNIEIGDEIMSYKDDVQVKGLITKVLTYHNNGEREMTEIGDLIGAPWHPTYFDGQWIRLRDIPNAITSTRYIDAVYNFEVDGHTIHDSEHNYIAAGFRVSGLGEDETLNSTFQRDDDYNNRKHLYG